MKCLIIFIFMTGVATLAGCTNSSNRGEQDSLNQEQRLEEPQQRDGVPEGAVNDSLEGDTL